MSQDQVEQFVENLVASLPPQAAAGEMPEAFGDRIKALIALFHGVMDGIDAAEAQAIMAKVAEAVAAFAAGQMLVGLAAVAQAMRMIRDAKTN